MTVKKRASGRSLGSDLDKVDAHVIRPHEYKELPALTEDMLSRARRDQRSRPAGGASEIIGGQGLHQPAPRAQDTGALEGHRPRLADPHG